MAPSVVGEYIANPFLKKRQKFLISDMRIPIMVLDWELRPSKLCGTQAIKSFFKDNISSRKSSHLKSVGDAEYHHRQDGWPARLAPVLMHGCGREPRGAKALG